VNTQSVALRLAGIADVVPLFVCLDATFAQLSRSPWFAPNALSRLFLPLTLGGILQQEKKLFQLAHALLPWSDCANASLRTDYALAKEQVHVLPPSLELPPRRASRPRNAKPSLLFVGGDFRRKGGPLLLKCFREHLAGRAELHIVTQSDVAPEPDVFVHRGLQAHSAAWHERWEQADVFVFPSTLETFGIVLLEALAFEVPVISANVGAAAEILENDDAGILLDKCDAASLTAALEELLNPSASAARVERGRIRIEKDFNLETNAARLAGWLREAG
jgi:glycosyltransferase involved in cell wall biosynthesis